MHEGGGDLGVRPSMLPSSPSVSVAVACLATLASPAGPAESPFLLCLRYPVCNWSWHSAARRLPGNPLLLS